jgi:hypothetical protein
VIILHRAGVIMYGSVSSPSEIVIASGHLTTSPKMSRHGTKGAANTESAYPSKDAK